MNSKPVWSILWLSASLVPAQDEPSPPRPNVVLLLADDQDWNGLSVSMHPDLPGSMSDYYETPNLARLAEQGMRFSNGYAPAPVCSPTRISLLTGMTPARLHWTKAAPPEVGWRLIEAESRRAIREDETTLAEVLARAGYATAHFGKWHLSGGGPERHGFDVSDGDTSNGDADRFVDPNPVDIFGMTERAVAFMKREKKRGRPFYLQMSYHALHRPENALHASRVHFDQKTKGRLHKDPARAAITADLDTGVGRLLEAIEQLDLEANTYVIYMADNGGGGGAKGRQGNDRPLSGGKGGLWESGIRVPFFARGPYVPAGSWCHRPVVAYDWFPTICHWARVEEVLPRELDGGDLDRILHGADEPVQRKDDALVFHFPHYQGQTPHSALREGNFKLLVFHEDGARHLFDLAVDPAESKDLAVAKPGLADRLEQKLRDRLQALGAAMPEKNPAYDPAEKGPYERTRKKERGERKREPKKRKGEES